MKVKYIKILMILLFIVSIIDVITTTYILSNGGSELNPFMVNIAKDPILFLIIKIGTMTYLTLSALMIFNKPNLWWMISIALTVPIGITLIAVINNLYVIFIYLF